MRDGKDVVVHAPTGSGKTLIFELLQSTIKGQAVFTVPTRALANDKLAEWRKRGWEVGIATGDISEGLDRKLIVATLETQRARLLSGNGPKLLVIDEYQMIADPVRGIHYEQVIALAPQTTQLLLLSGSVANPQDVVAWLQRIGRKAELIAHRERPVPLEEVDLQGVPDRAASGIRGWWPRVITNALRQDLGPILLFAPRRQAAETIALQLAATLPPCAPLHLTPEQQQLAGNNLLRLLRARVAFHHSGLSFAQRTQIVEPLAKSGQLRVVVATMGLAAGINFSMRSVAISGTVYRAGPFERTVTPAEILQMYGRAGRRGLDDTGYALVTPQPPRLGDAQPLFLRRSNQLDWPTLIAVMVHAQKNGTSPFVAATRLGERLFSTQKIQIGCELSLETGPTPCGLHVDHERARYLRRGSVEIFNSRKTWEPRPVTHEKVPLSEVWIHIPDSTADPAQPNLGKWRRAEGVGRFMKSYGSGAFCHLPGPHKRLGREMILGYRQGGALKLAPWLKAILGKKQIRAEDIERDVLNKSKHLTGGGSIVEMFPVGNKLVARVSYAEIGFDAYRDSFGNALLNPPNRRIVPAPCNGCSQREWCETTPITPTAAQAWRELGLIERDGSPTRRGVIFSFFQHGEGLAIAAALEDETYPIEDLVFDLANLRGGPRFAEEDTIHLGRLAVRCQQTYRHADHDGYLRFGIPDDYAYGACEAIRNIVVHGTGKQQLLTETLRMGDIERAILEWHSLLRHIANAPNDSWDRWIALKGACDQRLRAELKRLGKRP